MLFRSDVRGAIYCAHMGVYLLLRQRVAFTFVTKQPFILTTEGNSNGKKAKQIYISIDFWVSGISNRFYQNLFLVGERVPFLVFLLFVGIILLKLFL